MLNTNKKQNQSNLIGISQTPADAEAKAYGPKGVGCLQTIHTENTDITEISGRYARNYISHTDSTEITDNEYGKSNRLDGRCIDLKR